MFKLNKDVLYLIFEELQDDKKTLYSSLSINKTCCEIIIPILWRNPWKYLAKENIKILFNVVISHLSDESKNKLKAHCNDFSTILYQKLLFNYISFCKHLDLNAIDRIVGTFKHQGSNLTCGTLKNEIYNLFINENTKFTHLNLPRQFDYQIHLIPGAKHCFSEIVFLSCYTIILNDDVLTGLAEICQSIENFELISEEKNNNYGIIKLIDSFKKLTDVRLIVDLTKKNEVDKKFLVILRNSLMKHAHTIRHFKLSSLPPSSALVKIYWLELIVFDFLEDMSLSSLQILKFDISHVKAFRNLIVNANGSLTEISLDNVSFHMEDDNKIIIETIYQSCPNLKYLKLMLIKENFSELEQLLINCQRLNGLYFFIKSISMIDWDKLFEILTISSPTSLFKFKFNMIISCELIQLGSFKLFFMNWKGRQPMLLQLDSKRADLIDLIKEYKSEGIIKKFDYLHRNFKDFEW
ncbi:hypothetical protein RclHR1_00060009 [Rhizophagus clarus]|uniref:F-box domain-containing protein n=1 Tax=Rhizophagus clarus TaxID=94130 RepID=A0A2Z6RQ15_9GLOM|nr:hypothetical protein RclHR1_00060009 [Rhizophagus clarus]GES74589.1 hypothetical protein GLOIN_2v1877952 [Rhizophagus clarus]